MAQVEVKPSCGRTISCTNTLRNYRTKAQPKTAAPAQLQCQSRSELRGYQRRSISTLRVVTLCRSSFDWLLSVQTCTGTCRPGIKTGPASANCARSETPDRD